MARRASAETTREEAVNVLLAEVLRERGLSARAERRSRSGIPDVRVALHGKDSVILDCKWDGSETSLRAQLDERLSGFPDALGVIGVLYPERLRRAEDTSGALEGAQDLRWWIHGSGGQRHPDSRVRTGSAAELADHLRNLPLEIEGFDRVDAAAKRIGWAVEQAAGAVTGHARIARRIADLIASTDRENDRAAALRIGCLVLFNALAFQDRLAAVNEDVATVDEARSDGLAGLSAAWRAIREDIDYVPVFELAGEILDVLADAPEDTADAALAPLVEAVNDTRRLEGHDLSGRLFHTLLSDAKFTGAYYTSVPAATLLARLVFHEWPPRVDWSDHELPASLNVADLACGTGTLLMAVASEAERRHADAGGGECGGAAQGDGRAGAARLRRAALRRPLRRDEPRDAQPGHPVRPHEPLRDAARHRGRDDLARLARFPRPGRGGGAVRPLDGRRRPLHPRRGARHRGGRERGGGGRHGQAAGARPRDHETRRSRAQSAATCCSAAFRRRSVGNSKPNCRGG